MGTSVDDAVFIEAIIEAQAVLARHLSGQHASAEETVSELLKLFDSPELVSALAARGYSSTAFG